ncbi:MAG: hypothetical protein IJJ15_04225, partial [Ruminococcus sp.]|nr:hypothetical protein [Ruminococcus sp.]
TVAPTEAPTAAPTEAPTAAPTEAPTDAPAAPEYFLVGSFNEWTTQDANYALTLYNEENNEYRIGDVTLAKDAEFKVVSKSGAWYPDNYDNFKVTEDGTYDIYFRPNGNGNEDWFASVIYAYKQTPATAAPTEAPTQAPTQAPTEAPTQAPTQAPTSAPTEAPKNYVYLNPNIWNQNAGERYELYVWGGSGGAKWQPATKLSDSSYRFEVPDGYTSGIFVREDGSKPAGTWDSKWNQTVDLTLTGNIGKTFKVTDWVSNGSWS